MSIEDRQLSKSMMLNMKIDKHHPALPGHFPDNPIVPGVVILEHVMRLWQEENNHLQQKQSINKILNAKFVNLLRADSTCQIQYTAKAQHKIDFVVSIADEQSYKQKEESAPQIICKGLFSYI